MAWFVKSYRRGIGLRQVGDDGVELLALRRLNACTPTETSILLRGSAIGYKYITEWYSHRCSYNCRTALPSSRVRSVLRESREACARTVLVHHAYPPPILERELLAVRLS